MLDKRHRGMLEKRHRETQRHARHHRGMLGTGHMTHGTGHMAHKSGIGIMDRDA